MYEEAWERFIKSGKVNDYLEYKSAVCAENHMDGEHNGNDNSQGSGA